MIVHCPHDALVSIKDLKAHPKNRNKHPDAQIERLAKILEYQGWRYPVKVSKRSGLVTSGHGRIEAAKANGWKQVPVSFQDYADEEQEYADVQSDNAIASWAELDLSGINADLADLGPDFDLDLLGIKDFTLDMVEKLEPQCDEDEMPEALARPAVCRGEVYILGNHRLMCGDSTAITDVDRLMKNERADMAIADPPYNVGYEYNGIEDSKSENEYSEFCTEYLNNALSFTSFVAITPGKANEKFYNQREDFREYLVWFKKFGLSRGSFYKAMVTEPILLFGEKPKNKFYATDHIEQMTEREPGLRELHTCPKPVSLWCSIIEPMTDERSIVLEMFGGSGTTAIACEKTGRFARLIEIDPVYCGVILDRWQRYTGKKAIREDGKPWDEIKAGDANGPA